MPLINKIKNRLKTQYLTIDEINTYLFILIFIIVIGYSMVGSWFFEYTSLGIIDDGVHEFGHSAAIMAMGSNLTGIQINMNFNNYIMNQSSFFAHTVSNYDTSVTWRVYLLKIGGPLFGLIISFILLKAPYLRWISPIIAFENFMQILPITSSTDGFGILRSCGIIIASTTFIVFTIIYITIITSFAIYICNRFWCHSKLYGYNASTIWDYQEYKED